MKVKTSLLASALLLLASNAWADQLKVLVSDEAALIARYNLIKSAQKEILAEYFEFADDDTSIAGLALLQEAAQRGVKVKLLIDSMHNELDSKEMAAVTNTLNSLEGTKNFEIKVFNPLSSPNLMKLTYRNHDKLLNVDGEAMIVGGRNVADGYFGLSSKTNYRDMDVLISGESARKARDYFMKLWEQNPMVKAPRYYQHDSEKLETTQCYLGESDVQACENSVQNAKQEILRAQKKISEARSRLSALAGRFTVKSAAEMLASSDTVDVSFLFNDPTRVMPEVEDKLADQLFRYISENAKESLTIVTPYLFPTKRAMQMLKQLSERGVRIRIVTNSLASTDTPLVHSAFLTTRKKFKEMNAEVYEYLGPETLHMKVCVLDEGTPNASTMIGSFNFDRRSAMINREIGVTIKGRDASKVTSRIQSALDRVMADSVLSIKSGQDVNQDKLESALNKLGPEVAEQKKQAVQSYQGLTLKLLKDQI